jgi:hypothetical protein
MAVLSTHRAEQAHWKELWEQVLALGNAQVHWLDAHSDDA